jgi:hypothetical protein
MGLLIARSTWANPVGANRVADLPTIGRYSTHAARSVGLSAPVRHERRQLLQARLGTFAYLINWHHFAAG